MLRFPDGSSCKQTAQSGANLLDLFGEDGGEGGQPLFVSEGTAQEKEASIKRSNYLTFAHEQFALDPHPLVIFGQSLGERDAHLRRALLRAPNRRFALSMRPHGDPEAIIARKHEIHAALPNRERTFFDATTHPLGDPALKIPHEGD